MFKKFSLSTPYIVFTFLLFTNMLQAQTKQPMKTGEYYLEGVMEVGSGFRFNKDNTFNFFFSYGAIDRESNGTWEQKGDSIILNNAPKPEKDFAMVKSLKTKYNETVIKITDPNQMVIRNVACRLQTSQGELEGITNQYGEITFDKVQVDQISLIHEFWPDRFSDFTITEKDHNYFEFRIERWIVEVEFKNLVFKVEKGSLKGPHPIMQGKEFSYVRGEQ